MTNPKKRFKDLKRFEISGNKGGDYLLIEQDHEQMEHETCYIRVGSCCVVVLEAFIPVSLLTELISKFMIFNVDGSSRKTTDRLKDFAREVFKGHEEEYINKVCSQIKEVDWLGREK